MLQESESESESEFYLTYKTHETYICKIKANLNVVKRAIMKKLDMDGTFDTFRLGSTTICAVNMYDEEEDKLVKLINKYNHKWISPVEVYKQYRQYQYQWMLVPMLHKKFKGISKDIVRETIEYI
jgi:hypothetical protein